MALDKTGGTRAPSLLLNVLNPDDSPSFGASSGALDNVSVCFLLELASGETLQAGAKAVDGGTSLYEEAR